MTKKNSHKLYRDSSKLKLQEKRDMIRRYSSTKREIGTIAMPLPTEASNSVIDTAGPNLMKLQQQTTGIIPSSSLPEPMIITTSEPSSTASNFGSSHQKTAAEKAEDDLLASIVIPDLIHYKEITEDDIIATGWFVTPGQVPVSKGRTLTQMIEDSLVEAKAKYPLPPDYDSDEEWGGDEGHLCVGINHMANEETNMQGWFRSCRASSAPPMR